MSRRARRLAGVLASTALVACAAPAAARDYAATALNIVPSGQPGGLPVPEGADAQARMYDALTPLFDQVTPADLRRTFKSEGFGVGPDGPARAERVPRRGVRIRRDRYDVPHIRGRSRDDVTWATGWVLAQDRALLLAQGRTAGYLAALDAPNVDAFSIVTQLKSYTPSASARRIVERNGLAALRSVGAAGRRVLHDIDVYVDGINARLRADRSAQPPFTRADVFALNALAGQIFGKGGGGEAQRSAFLGALTARLGAGAAQTLFDDLTERVDDDHPSTLTTAFPYGGTARNRGGSVVLDAGSLRLETPGGANAAAATVAGAAPPHASNFLLVGRERSTTGHPLFVAGPQIGYFYPGLTLEMDLEGPGFQARGVAAPGFAGNILIGRGPDFAWSLTSAGSDLIDVFAETLCGGSRSRYRHDGRCRTMGAVNAGTIRGTGAVRYRTTVHGPVIGYATVGGRRVALASRRASFGRDVLWQLPFRDATVNRIDSAQAMIRAFGRSPFTFNVAYADDRDIAVFSAGRLPLRDPRTDPRLPTRGEGDHEWRGFLPRARHPQQVNPSTGTLLNWNNRPAPGWAAADNNWQYGSAHRVQLLQAGIDRRERHDLASVVGAMNAAATQDLRSIRLTPVLARLLRGVPAPSARAQRALELLEGWLPAGSSRLDRDLDGQMDAGAAPAIMDALYPRLVDAVFAPVLGPELEAFKALVGRNGSRSDFTGGAIGHLDKDLRTLAGESFRDPFRTRFCGGGDLDSCRAALWRALDEAAGDLAAAQGENPDAWRADANAERIRFAPGLLQTTIRYTNRPSGIQQVLSFDGHRPRP